MTTIAYDGTTIAADGQVMCDGRVVETDHDKLVIRDGRIFGYSGALSLRDAMVDWWCAGRVWDLVPKNWETTNFAMLVIEHDRSAWVFSNGHARPDRYRHVPIALGTGERWAEALMAGAGMSAGDAIRTIITKQLDVHTGGVVFEINIADVGLAPVEFAVAAE